MGRNIQVPGECMVEVKGNAALNLSGEGFYTAGQLHQLGLAVDQIQVTPVFRHRDIRSDDFGETPPEIMNQAHEVNVKMTLIHFDEDVLNACIMESMGGGVYDVDTFGRLAPGGRLLGNNKPLMTSGCHYISLGLRTAVGEPWYFPAAYLAEQPAVYPVGVQAQAAALNWRAIPYQFYRSAGAEILSSGVQLWQRINIPS